MPKAVATTVYGVNGINAHFSYETLLIKAIDKHF